MSLKVPHGWNICFSGLYQFSICIPFIHQSCRCIRKAPTLDAASRMRYARPVVAVWAAMLWVVYGTPASKPVILEHATLRDRADVKDTYDYVIVGAGTAGLTLADRLTESG